MAAPSRLSPASAGATPTPIAAATSSPPPTAPSSTTSALPTSTAAATSPALPAALICSIASTATPSSTVPSSSTTTLSTTTAAATSPAPPAAPIRSTTTPDPANPSATGFGMDGSNIGGTKHLFLCHGDPKSWSEDRMAREEDYLPHALAKRIAARLPKGKVTLAVFSHETSPAFDQGDVALFPEMICFRGLGLSEIDEFVERVLYRGEKSWKGKGEEMVGSFGFVCCDSASVSTPCSICGPLLLSKLRKEAHDQGIGYYVEFFPCMHIGGADALNEVSLFKSMDGASYAQDFWVSHVNPGEVRPMLSAIFGNGNLTRSTSIRFMHFWNMLPSILRHQFGLSEFINSLSALENVRSGAGGLSRVKMMRELVIRMCIMKLKRLVEALVDAARRCNLGEIDFDWKGIVSGDLLSIVDSLRASASSGRGSAEKCLPFPL